MTTEIPPEAREAAREYIKLRKRNYDQPYSTGLIHETEAALTKLVKLVPPTMLWQDVVQQVRAEQAAAQNEQGEGEEGRDGS